MTGKLMKAQVLGSVVALCLGQVAMAGDIEIREGYVRSSNPKVAAAFMEIVNTSETPDRLIGAESAIAARTEIHTHVETDGVMRMIKLEEGIEVPAGGSAMLMRGGDHVMFMGLTTPVTDGETVTATLIFEVAGPQEVAFVVDNKRKEKHGHSGH